MVRDKPPRPVITGPREGLWQTLTDNLITRLEYIGCTVVMESVDGPFGGGWKATVTSADDTQRPSGEGQSPFPTDAIELAYRDYMEQPYERV